MRAQAKLLRDNGSENIAEAWECVESKIVPASSFFDPHKVLELTFPDYKWGFVIRTFRGFVFSNAEGKEAVEVSLLKEEVE